MENNKDLNIFVEMCKNIKFDGDEFFYQNTDHLNENEQLNKNISESLLNKMDKLINIINKNPKMIETDIETELWKLL